MMTRKNRERRMTMDLKELYNNQSEEVKAKLKACTSEQEMMKVLDEEKIELDPEILDEVSGGGLSTPRFIKIALEGGC